MSGISLLLAASFWMIEAIVIYFSNQIFFSYLPKSLFAYFLCFFNEEEIKK